MADVFEQYPQTPTIGRPGLFTDSTGSAALFTTFLSERRPRRSVAQLHRSLGVPRVRGIEHHRLRANRRKPRVHEPITPPGQPQLNRRVEIHIRAQKFSGCLIKSQRGKAHARGAFFILDELIGTANSSDLRLPAFGSEVTPTPTAFNCNIVRRPPRQLIRGRRRWWPQATDDDLVVIG